MSTKIKDSFSKIGLKDIESLQNELGFIFPKEYFDFLLKTNGGRPSRVMYKTKGGEFESHVNWFYGIASGAYDIKHQYLLLKGRMSDKEVPIGDDSYGNFILLNIETSKVSFFDHETDEVWLVEDSFSSPRSVSHRAK